MRIERGQRLELTIESMAYGGQGVARTDGLVVFARHVAPGDRVLARVHKRKKAFLEASVVSILKPSADRVPPPCPYSGLCGGCQWQHLRYDRQLVYKQKQIMDALARIGRLKDVVVREALPSENLFSYRNKMEFSFSDRQWLPPHETNAPGASEGFALGLHVPGTFYKVLDVDACLLQPETGNQILHLVKEHVRDSGVPVYGLKSHRGFWRFLVLRHSRKFDVWLVNLVTSTENGEAVGPLAHLLEAHAQGVKAIVNNVNQRKASIAVGEREIVVSGTGFIRDQLGPYSFRVSANSFFQPNPHVAERMYQQVADFAELRGNETVVDLYSGTGAIAIFLSERVRSVTGIEISESAILDAQQNCRENGIDNCQFILGDVRERLAGLPTRPHVLIMDPPRAGIHKRVLAQVLDQAPERIVYLSCNPTTLARDLGLMIDHYEVLDIQPFDMFPHTYHVEAVAKLHLRKR